MKSILKKIVIAPDSFKGTMTQRQVCDIIEEKLSLILPDAEVIKIHAADGGEGTTDAFLYALGGEKIFVKVKSPIFESIDVYYAILPAGNVILNSSANSNINLNSKENKKTAVIELAAASGLMLAGNKKNPFKTSTYGTGQLIADALEKGCERIILGLGGSATNDGGIGIMAALGVKFLDLNGREIALCNEGLEKLARIDYSEINPKLKKCEIIAACDVDNPMCGENGASYIFAPQKGAYADDLKYLDDNLSHYADILCDYFNIDVRNIKSTGAAGGVLASFLCFCGCEIKSGIEIFLDTINFDNIIKDADLIITGEGKFDSQSVRGKVPYGIAASAKKQNVPVIVLTGDCSEYNKNLGEYGISSVFSIVSGVKTFDEIKNTCYLDLADAVENLFNFYNIFICR